MKKGIKNLNTSHVNVKFCMLFSLMCHNHYLNTSHVNVKLVAVSDIVSDIPSFKYISC